MGEPFFQEATAISGGGRALGSRASAPDDALDGLRGAPRAADAAVPSSTGPPVGYAAPSTWKPPKTAVCIQNDIRVGGEPESSQRPDISARSCAVRASSPGMSSLSPSRVVLEAHFRHIRMSGEARSAVVRAAAIAGSGAVVAGSGGAAASTSPSPFLFCFCWMCWPKGCLKGLNPAQNKFFFVSVDSNIVIS